MSTDKNLYMVWIDCEMTGLSQEKDYIIEIATIVTDDQLNVVAEGPVLAIHQSDEILNGMDEWCTTHHGASGLTQRVRESTVTMEQAQDMTLDFIKQHVPPNVIPLCGNSVSQDRRFLRAQMPKLEAYLHYRDIDVSSIKELAKRWAPEVFKKVKKENTHLALDDIKESIEELRLYREHFFNVEVK